MIRLLLIALLLTGSTMQAQDAPPRPSPLVVMNLAAHPDDEDGATLTYYRHAKDAIAYSVIYTRGEGGQNEIGPELYEALGAIRTAESERAARHLGTQLYFLNFYDFGFSKSADEAFEIWGGRDAVTARLVYLLRKLKPDVLFTNHDTVTVGPNRQHGHHQAVGVSTYDAFALAADPTFHPEQLDEPGVDLWQPKRLFLRRRNADANCDVQVPVGDLDPATGKPYVARAADALREHASQGMDRWADRFSELKTNCFVLLRSATDAPLDPSDLAGNLPPNSEANPPLAYRIDAGWITPLPDGTFFLDDDVLVRGQQVRMRWQPEQLPARRARLVLHGAIDTTLYLADDTPGTATLTVRRDAVATTPEAVYQYERFVSRSPATYVLYQAGSDSVLAAGYLPVEIAPPLRIETQENVVRLHPGANQLPVLVQAFDPVSEKLTLSLAVSQDTGETVVFQQQSAFAFDTEGIIADTLHFTLPASLADGAYTVTITGLAAPSTLMPEPVHLHLDGQVFEVNVPDGLHVGVVQSYDNTMAQALEQLSVAYQLLDSLDLAQGDLDAFQTIVVDIRGYLVRPDLRAHNDRLLDWVRRGGHLVVNYQKTIEWNEDYDDPFLTGRKNPAGFAPYPLRLGRERVTREDASVTLRQPDHVLLHRPNEITPDAWTGWVQERGLYFPATYDDAYQPLFCLNDPGEEPLCNSTLLAEVGEGTYLYSALVWYRQLKQYHPGAYALFANLISLPLVDGRVAGSTP